MPRKMENLNWVYSNRCECVTKRRENLSLKRIPITMNEEYQIIPWAVIASATLRNPAILAPAT